VKQLKGELEQWYEALPPAFKFERNFTVYADSNARPPYMDPRFAMLRADYFGHKIRIDWPLIDLIITGGLTTLGPSEEEVVRKWIVLIFRFIPVVTTLVDHYHPNLWIKSNAYALWVFI
jgi:hypothetical protein